MNVKKTIVSALSISSLALSVSGVASAHEISSSPVTDAKNITVSPSHIIKIQNYNLPPLHVGETDSVYNSVATKYWSDNSSVASVDSYGTVTANAVGTANITLYKGNSVLGVVHVRVW
ncbi:Ig-like domain-containing protein [Bacillus sp. 0102A]|uniref:Ig-like domain-containing protein n=1 Tax=Bacillus sp. 0102A TaxID=3120563 RepID=UPI002FD89FE9